MDKVLYQNLPAHEAIRRITRSKEREVAMKKVKDAVRRTFTPTGCLYLMVGAVITIAAFISAAIIIGGAYE